MDTPFFDFKIYGFDSSKSFSRRSGDYMSLGYMTCGSALITEGKSDVIVAEGDFFFIPKDSTCICSFKANPRVSYIRLDFSYLPSENEYAVSKTAATKETKEIIEKIIKNPVVCCENIANLYLLLSEITKNMKEKTKTGALVSKAKEYIRNNPTASVAAVAGHLGISESGFYALFKAQSGITPLEMKQRVNIDMAINLLKTTDLPIEEISYRLNFSSSSYFRKIFYKYTGKSPREVRKEK